MILLALSWGCEKLPDEILTSETDDVEMDFTIQATRKGFQIFSEEVFRDEISNALDQAGIQDDQLESVTLNEAEFSIVSQGAYTNFNILEFIELTVYQDSLGEKKIAVLNPVPRNKSSVQLSPVGDNLMQWLNGNTFVITAQGYLLENLYEDVDLHARMKFMIKGGK